MLGYVVLEAVYKELRSPVEAVCELRSTRTIGSYFRPIFQDVPPKGLPQERVHPLVFLNPNVKHTRHCDKTMGCK